MALTPEKAKATERADSPTPSDDVEQSDGIRFLNEEESREHFDRQARRLLGISGDEFLRRYDAGEYNREMEDRELRGVMKLRMLEDCCGRTPQEAVRNALEPLKSVIACITAEGFVARHGRRRNGVHTADFQDEFAILDRRNGQPLKLELRHRYVVIQMDGDWGRWTASTAEYIYEISDERDDLLVAWHWHPTTVEMGDDAHWPHLHAYGDRETLTLHKLHLPTGRVSLEAIVRFLIDDLSVVPRRDDWRTVLSHHEDAFRQGRSWA